MAQHKVVVTERPPDAERLPDEWASFVAIATGLRGTGILDQVARRLGLVRGNGYGALDLLLFVTGFLLQRGPGGMRGYSDRCRPHGAQLAAVCGRRRWPTQASVSRGLASMQAEAVTAFGEWLLLQAVDFTALNAHSSVVSRDTHGQGWHMLDFDPTVTVFRQRALPRGDDLPEARRRKAAIAAPGYSGRKRGKVQVNRALLQHAGTSQWLGMWMAPGNGEGVRDLERAAKTAHAWAIQAGISPRATVLRFDGGVSSADAIQVCRDTGVCYLTRWAGYELLQRSGVAEHLEAARWSVVPDSLSGPRREAAELGQVTLRESSSGGLLKSRMVVSRFPSSFRRGGAGKVSGAWHYELFITDLPADSWPAGDTVSAYYGRCGQENRFLQEDRELGLDRTFSNHSAGQQFATLVGLFLWNLRVSLGFAAQGLSTHDVPRMSSQTLPHPEPVPQPQHALVCEPPAEVTVEDHPPSPESASRADPLSPTSRVRKIILTVAVRAMLMGLFSPAVWASKLTRLPGWRWCSTENTLFCPDGKPTSLYSVQTSEGRTVVIFRGIRALCGSCAQRSLCSKSTSKGFQKEVWFTFRSGELPALDAHLDPNNSVGLACGPPRMKRPKPTLVLAATTPDAATATQSPCHVRPPMLIPTTLRKAADALLALNEVRVRVDLGAPAQKPHPAIAETSARRQQRRATWSERLRINALPADSTVEIQLRGNGQTEKILKLCARVIAPAGECSAL